MRCKAMLISILFLYLTCSKLPPSVGRSRDVVVIGSGIDTALVIGNIQINNYFPQKEPTFVFILAPDTAIRSVNKFHNMFLYGSLKDNFINTLLSADAKEAAKRDTFTLFKIHDLWAKNQTAVILAVSEPGYVVDGFARYRNTIVKLLEESYYQNLKAKYYEQGIDKGIKRVLEKYGFTLDLQKGWMVDSTYSSSGFVFVHTHFPDRSVFYYREKAAGTLNDSFALDKRNALTKKYYNGDYILKELTTAEVIEFNDMKGIRLKGVWQNDSLVAGGPFLTYFLQDKDTLNVIDGLLFLPGERKTDYFMTIEIIMNSFKTRTGNPSP